MSLTADTDPELESAPGGRRSPERTVKRPGRLWAPVVRSSAFVRKELVEILRQPRLLALLVLGPFLLLVVFGAGYSASEITLRAVFVGEEGSEFEELLSERQEELRNFVEIRGFVYTEEAGLSALRDGLVDVVVLFPDDPVATILGGQQAEIRVFHDEVDPLQQTVIWAATRLAVQEVNAAVLSSLVSSAQDELAPVGSLVDELDRLAPELERASDDPAAQRELGEQMSVVLTELSLVLESSLIVFDRFEAEDAATQRLETAADAAYELRLRADAVGTDEDLGALATDTREFVDEFADVVALDPNLIVRPFEGSIFTVVPRVITPTDYFTPSAVALLLQHLGVTFAALSLVRDRSTGLIELIRSGPMLPTEIIIGKSLAYLLLGGVVASALLSAAIFLLGVPMVGDAGWLVAVVAGVVLASIALGMVLSGMSGTESQAVQFAMLSLLAGLFFSGFVLSIDDLVFPVNLLPWLLPVTYGIRAFQDVMFRSVAPAPADLIGLTVLVLVYGVIAIIVLRRTLKIS
jgi:ABC-2 type transport system permease protein